MINIILWGLGQQFDFFNKCYCDYEEKDFHVIGVADKKVVYLGDKYTQIQICDINRYNYDSIIITSVKYFEEIKDELVSNLAIESNKIMSLIDLKNLISSRIFKIDEYKEKIGIEIGGPSKIFENNIYKVAKQCDGLNFNSKTVWWEQEVSDYEYNNKKLGKMIISDVTYMKTIENDTYDFCISSNNLEHVANPLKAIEEMKRIIKRSGILLILVPVKDLCFDHNRCYTEFSHILQDYVTNTDESDLSHLKEVVEKHDIKMDAGIRDRDELYERGINNYENRCLHHHVFSTNLLKECVSYFNMHVIDTGQLVENFYIIARK